MHRGIKLLEYDFTQLLDMGISWLTFKRVANPMTSAFFSWGSKTSISLVDSSQQVLTG